MRRVALSVAAAASALASPVAAQTTTSKSLGQAISNTVAQSVTERLLAAGHSPASIADGVAKTIQGLKNLNTTIYNSTCGAGSSWACWLIYLQVPQGTTMAGGGSFGGGGASGSWEEGAPCDDFKFRLDAAGNVIIPAIPLKVGTAMKRGQPGAADSIVYNAVGTTGVESSIYAKTPPAANLWQLHSLNLSRGTPNRFFGVYHVSATGQTWARMPAYFGTNGALVSMQEDYRDAPQTSSFCIGCEPADCPPMAVSGGDFHFYYRWQSDQCVNYAPNPQLGLGGYAMNPETALTYAEFKNFPNGRNAYYKNCKLSPALIQALADAAYKKASKLVGYDGIPHSPITPDDVRTGGEEPTLQELGDPPAIPDPSETSTPPTPDPTPTPTPTSTPDAPWSDPAVGDPAAPEIDWWPDLPTIEVDLGSPACPTYQLNLVGWWDTPFVLDSHCPLIEQNRAAISLLMIAMFSMMSMFIVLRA